ncbi:hypothetical protein ACWEGS_28585 [Streptomyces sp. NPDC004822]
MDIVEASIAAVAAAFSGYAAFYAMRAAKSSDRNSQAANRTAELAYQTAESVARIERDRWHRELTPQLRLRVDPNQHKIYVRFDGPVALKQLHLHLHIRDDRDRSEDPVLAGAYTAEQRAAVIWGPYRFQPGIDRADEQGRSAGPFTLAAQDLTLLAVQPTLRPEWFEGPYGEDRWRSQYRTAPLRLWVDCEAEGHNPWRLSFELPWEGSWAETGVSQPL